MGLSARTQGRKTKFRGVADGFSVEPEALYDVAKVEVVATDFCQIVFHWILLNHARFRASFLRTGFVIFQELASTPCLPSLPNRRWSLIGTVP